MKNILILFSFMFIVVIGVVYAEQGASKKVIVACAEDGGQITWRYTTNIPPENWFVPRFDDRRWPEGTAGFGTKNTPGARVGTEWTTGQIWLRRSFDLPNEPIGFPVLRIHHDEDVAVFINGVLVAQMDGFQTGYVDRPLDREILQILKPGKNYIAVTCLQKKGGQYIDVGVVDRAPPIDNGKEDGGEKGKKKKRKK